MAYFAFVGLSHLTVFPLTLLTMSLSPLMNLYEVDFSSNAHTPNPCTDAFANHKSTEFEVPIRHPELCFVDGSVAILCGRQYFLVHLSLLSLHSTILKRMVEAAFKDDTSQRIEGRPALVLPHMPGEMYIFLKAIYGLIKQTDVTPFPIASALLRLATIYEAATVRSEIIGLFQATWTMSLPQWEIREKNATDTDGVYSPRDSMAHPIYTDQDTGVVHYLSQEDLFRVFRGKEQAARYFSTFIVKELEGRVASEWCHNRAELQPARKRRCQVAYEAVTYALIRDVNGLVLNRNSDPLYAISDSLLMQTRDDLPGLDNRATVRACEACRLEYAAVVEAAREEFWRRLPEWFELEVPNWG
ncbi:hypothetical protein BC835DRAFT_1380071 [Cytidiella melzeri]|nr:hypothetical protein BC835DRAFT_1380071 [Cytidiella melzeri]